MCETKPRGVADDDSIYALGVMNINYVRFSGKAGIMSRADFVMLSIRLGAGSSAWAELNVKITVRPINRVFI
jgi:hypothetical protein